jgi:hypothetical protein
MSNSIESFSMPISLSQIYTIDKFLHEYEISDLYREYKWKKDVWDKDNGFSDLFHLEQEIVKAAQDGLLCQDHLLKIAKWGGLRNKNKIFWAEPNKIKFYIHKSPAEWLIREPEKAISILEDQINGFGPTYCSKLLQFAVPQLYGALDTRLVRTFGRESKWYPLLDLKVTRSGNGWMIPKHQPGWPREYGTWIHIINHIANTLNRNGTRCPHPRQYEESGLRANGNWLPADVETALFSYTYRAIKM